MKILLQIFFCLLLACYAAQCLAEDARVALMPSGDPKAGAIVDLLTAELSAEEDLILLEREMIRLVLAEHDLALDGQLSTDDALTLGGVLGSDILVEIHYRADDLNTPDMVRAVGFDAITGVRLCDVLVPLEQGQQPEAAETLRTGLLHGVYKWRQIRMDGGSARTISFTESRGMDLPISARQAPALIALLLERELLRSPKIAVLERRRLDLINQERNLASIAHDRLLASSVRIDLDVLPTTEELNIEARVTLSDASGIILGTARHIGRADNPAAMAMTLTSLLAEKLDIDPDLPNAQACRLEALRLFGDSKALRSRAETAYAALLMEASLALAETALTEMPDDTNLKRIVAYIIQNKAATEPDSWRRLELLERIIELSEGLPAVIRQTHGMREQLFDTRSTIGHFAAFLRRTLEELEALPGQKNTNNPRLLALRRRYGQWMLKMRQSDWRHLIYFERIELYAGDLDEALKEADRHLTFLAPDLNLNPRSLPAFARHRRLLYPLESYTPEQRRKLLSLYTKWAKIRSQYYYRLPSEISAAVLLNTFPDDNENTNMLIDQHLQRAAQMAAKFNVPNIFLDSMQFQRDNKWHAAWKPFPEASVTAAMLVLKEGLLSNGFVFPELYVELEQTGMFPDLPPGALLEKAYRLLESGTHRLPHRANHIEPPIEPALELLASTSAKTYNRTIEPKQTSAPILASVTEAICVFDAGELAKIVAAERTAAGVHLLLDYGDSYEVRRIDLFDGQTVSLGIAPKRYPFIGRTSISHIPIESVITVGDNTVCVPGKGGITVFSTTGGEPWTIGMEHGLPADLVLAVREVGGMLYISCRGEEEGYLLTSRLDGSEMTILAGSGIREERSELDNTLTYAIESLYHDKERGLLFIVAIIPGTWSGWLYGLDLKTGRISRVDSRHNFWRQLRQVGKEQYAVRVHSNSRNLNGVPDYWGYGVWDSSSFDGRPVKDQQRHIRPLMGSVHRDVANWSGGLPHFSVSGAVTPLSTGALVLWDDKHLIASDGETWSLAARTDAGGLVQELPLLGNTAPFWLDTKDKTVLACTAHGLWLVKLDVYQSQRGEGVKSRESLIESGGAVESGEVPVRVRPRK